MNRIIQKAKSENRSLVEPEAWQLAASYGLTLPPYAFAESDREAVKAAAKVGYPLAVKVVSKDIVHKSNIGGVRIGIQNDAALAHAIAEMRGGIARLTPDAEIAGWMLTAMVKNGYEFIVGASRDQQFGPVVVCGMGGIFVELFCDTVLRLAPVETEEALEMLAELRSGRLLKGYRGQAPCDARALARSIVCASQLIAENPDIAELDFNPVNVSPEGAVVLDARILLG